MRLPGFLVRMPPQNRTLTMLVGVVVLMTSLSFAAVPFYNWFCSVTGYAGTVSVAEQGSDVILDRTILIRFDASLEAGMPWDFRPVQTEMTLRIGETALAFYEAYNPTDRAVAGTASYNVAKLDCFCFTQQVLQPHARAQMPVSFYVDPSIVDDPEGKFVQTITLSYTFHETEPPEVQADLNTVNSAPAVASN